jgi:serine/threonine protein kinase
MARSAPRAVMSTARALKFLPQELTREPEAKTRFIREAQAAAVLNHPNICTVYEVGEHDGQSFIAMELVEGQSLKDRLGGEPPRTCPRSLYHSGGETAPRASPSGRAAPGINEKLDDSPPRLYHPSGFILLSSGVSTRRFSMKEPSP